MSYFIRINFVGVFLLVACAPTSTYKTDPYSPTDSNLCTPACNKLRDMNCDEGSPLQDGTTCESFCLHTQESGHHLNPGCIVDKAKSCDDIDTICSGVVPQSDAGTKSTPIEQFTP